MSKVETETVDTMTKAMRNGWGAMFKVASSAFRVPAEFCTEAANALEKADTSPTDPVPAPDSDLTSLNARIDDLEKKLKVLNDRLAEP